MPTKRGEDDKDYQPGFTRKGQGYDPARDNQNISSKNCDYYPTLFFPSRSLPMFPSFPTLPTAQTAHLS